MKEIWKDIPRYENLYQASNLGRVRTHKNKITANARVSERHWKQRVLKYKSASNRTGYRVDLWQSGKPKTLLVCRLVATTFLDDLIETSMTVNHIDGNRFNNNIYNLEWCTRKENIQKGFQDGLYKQDEVTLKNIKTQEVHIFTSKAKASRYLKRNSGYISLAYTQKRKVISSETGTEYEIISVIKGKQKEGTSLKRLIK